MNNISYEEATKKLNEIIAKLEDGNLSIDQAIKSLEEGATLIKHCYSILDDAKGKLSEIKETLNGLQETYEN